MDGLFLCWDGLIQRISLRSKKIIAEYILNKLTEIVALCIHDSFIVQKEHETTLREVMQEAYYETGMALSLPTIE